MQPASPSEPLEHPREQSPTRASGSPSRCKVGKENDIYRQKTPSPVGTDPKSLRADRGNSSESHLLFIGVVLPASVPGKLQVQGAPWHKEAPEVLLLGSSLAGPAVGLWGRLCVPDSSRNRVIGLSDKYVSCHFSEKAVCELLLLRGSKGKYTQPLAPSPFLSPQGKVSALYLEEENLQPQEEAGKEPLSWNSCLQILYLSNNWGVLPQQLLCNSEWSEET